MSRTFQDDELLLWEAYAVAPRAGEHHGGRIMFHCLTDRTRRARIVEREEDRTALARRITAADEDELVELLGQSDPLN